MSPRVMGIAGALVLLFAWAGPLPGLVPQSFAAHMWLHMLVVGVAVPLIAAWLAPRLAITSALALPIVVSLLDFVVVWGWHAPALHHASRSLPLVLVAEQASFFAISLLVWLVALSGRDRGNAAMGGAMALFFTSMHMTLLGALLGLSPRPLYKGHHGGDGWLGLAPLADQQVGGVVMLAIGGVVYLAGGLILMARVLRRAPA
jgi:putative membrane protein